MIVMKVSSDLKREANMFGQIIKYAVYVGEQMFKYSRTGAYNSKEMLP